MADSKEMAQRQHKAHEMFGLQARQELSVVEVSQICKDYLLALASIAQLQDAIRLEQAEHAQTREQLEYTKQQRDSANGKLSALQRKLNKEGADADTN